MKIDFELYEKVLMKHLVNVNILSPIKSEEVMFEIRDFIGTNLRCKRCGKFFEDEAFYKSGVQKARRHRYIVCKFCYKNYISGGEDNV